MSEYLEKMQDWLLSSGINFLIALIIVLVIFKLINLLSNGVIKKNSQNVDKAALVFIVKFFKVLLKVVVFLFFLDYIGVQTAGIAASIASIGLTIGLALQGSLSNFAGGVMVIFLRPFKTGDYIEASGYSGSVEEIKFFYTYLKTSDNKVVMIPNGTLVDNVIINYSAKEYRRLDMVFSISYSSDFNKAKEVLNKLCDDHLLIQDTPEPLIRVGAHSDSSIDINCNVWVKRTDYATVKYDLLESVKTEFDSLGIEIPYNTIDVNIVKN